MNRFGTISLFAIIILAIFPSSLRGVGAYPFPRQVQQPDGTVLTIKLHGDEWFNWISTIDGFRVIPNQEGVFEYAAILKSGHIVPSGVKASDPAQRQPGELNFISASEPGPLVCQQTIIAARQRFLSPYLKSAGNFFPPTGQHRLLVILANFSDTQPSFGQADFYRFLNEQNYNSTGSFRDFFLENSMGKLDVTSVVTRWVTLPHPRAYYAPRGRWGEFAYHAIQAAHAAGVDFSQFDNTGNGVVEGVAIIQQGPGQEVTGNVNDIWSHAWSLSAAGYTTSQRRFNGVLVDNYTVQPETRVHGGAKNTIGVMVHEFGHLLGLPDFYDTNGFIDGLHEGTGRWDAMAVGNFNGWPRGSAPANFNPLSKAELGWVRVSLANSPGNVVLRPVVSAGEVLRVNSQVAHDYYLLENRQLRGFDRALPGHGMVVYHVDSARVASLRHVNEINASSHQGLMVRPASGFINSAAAPFPGSMLVTGFTDTTIPAMLTWSGLPFNRSITGITIDTLGNVLFDFMALQNGSPLTFTALPGGAASIVLEWEPATGGYPVMLAWSADGIFGNPEQGQTYLPGDIIPGGGAVLYFGTGDTIFTHGLLESSTRFYYRLWSYTSVGWSGALSASARTLASTINAFPWSDSFENGLVNWEQEVVQSNHFWESRVNGIAMNPGAAYHGSLFASFFVESFTPGVTRLISPPLDFNSGSTYILDFKHVQAAWGNDQDELRVKVKNEPGGQWQQVALYDTPETEWVARRVALPGSGVVRVAFQGHGNYGYGIGVDDVIVREEIHCFPVAGSPVVTSISVTGVDYHSARLNWEVDGNLPVLVVLRQTKSPAGLPSQGTAYTPGTHFGSGDSISQGAFVVFKGQGNSVLINGLKHSTTYHASIFPYAGHFCYAFEPARHHFSTRSRTRELSFVVSSGGLPVAGARVELGGRYYYAGPDGRASINIMHGDNYIPFAVTFNGYRSFWDRVKPVQDEVVHVELIRLVPFTVNGFNHTLGNDSIKLEWNPVIDEDFEGYGAFALSMPGWTMIDNDRGVTWGISGHPFPNTGYTGSFIVIDPFHETLLQAGFDISAKSSRHLVASFASRFVQNDDWLVTPPFKVLDGYNFSFWARSLSSAYGLEQMQVLVATGESDFTDFTILPSQPGQVPVEWTRYSFSLDWLEGRRVRIAIRHVSSNTFALLLDKIRVGVNTGSGEYSVSPAGVYDPKPSGEARRVAPEVSPAQKFSFARSPGGATSLTGGISYEVVKQGYTPFFINGFANAGLLTRLMNCSPLQFRARAIYNEYDIASGWSVDYNVQTCFRVTFLVKNETGTPVRGAGIDFNSESRVTGEDGITVFENVKWGSGLVYNVYIDNQLSRSGLTDVVEDTQIVISDLPAYADTVQGMPVEVFPNPFNHQLTVRGIPVSSSVTVVISDLTGRVLSRETLSGSPVITIDTSLLNPGAYILEVTWGDKPVMFKVLKH